LALHGKETFHPLEDAVEKEIATISVVAGQKTIMVDEFEEISKMVIAANKAAGPGGTLERKRARARMPPPARRPPADHASAPSSPAVT
jgi:hypothetical protein